MMQLMEERAKSIAADWATFMEIDPELFDIQVGSFDRLTDEAEDAKAWLQGGNPYGVTIGNPQNTKFIIGINETTPDDKLEHVIIHELVHVYSFAAVGADERDNLELLTDQVALLIRRLRKAESAHAALGPTP